MDYVIQVLTSPLAVDAGQWDALLQARAEPNPFMRHAYLAALHASGAASPKTGWTPRFVTLWLGEGMVGACALYLKAHSYGEYVFDHAWANAYHQHGLKYYPKALVAVPFTPVPGARLLARTPADRTALVRGLVAWCEQEKLSSLHLLFANDDDVAACASSGLMLRHGVQFHWKNVAPTLVASRTTLPPEGANSPRGGPSDNLPRTFASFEEFLNSLSQEKRKKIRHERRKVAEAGVTFRHALGADISTADWDFFYRCYERTYLEHGNAPYLSRDFFQRMADTMPENWLLFVAERESRPIAVSLIAISGMAVALEPDDNPNASEESKSIATKNISNYLYETWANGINDSSKAREHDISGISSPSAPAASRASIFTEPVFQPVDEHAVKPVAERPAERMETRIAYGRYWGALERVDCLHFEACYYQPLQWCIEHGFQRFEGGAQGEHKMARALMPVKTTSAHWLAQPAFADAVERFLEREGQGIENYMADLSERSPYRNHAGRA